MEKIRSVLAIATLCAALVALGLPNRVAAQENPSQGLPHREGSWDMIKVQGTGIPFGHSLRPDIFSRETKDLPIGTRERTTRWGHPQGEFLISASLLFQNIRETVTIDSSNRVDFKPALSVKADVTGKPGLEFVVFKYVADITTRSGFESDKARSQWDKRIYAGGAKPIVKSDNRFVDKGEWTWDLFTFGPFPRPEEDFILSVSLLVFTGPVTLDYPASALDLDDPFRGEATYRFFYKWAGWRETANAATSALGKPGSTRTPVVEEIPETDVTIASNKPRTKPVVEEIPETATTASQTRPNRPAVEEIPETDSNDRGDPNRQTNRPASTNTGGASKLPDGVTRDANGNLKPKNGYEWVNPNDPNDFRVRKKPKDPNKPDIWTKLGGAIREGLTGQTGQGDQGGNTGGGGSGSGGVGGNNGGGGGGQGLNLAGTWRVTTQSTGDDELQQNWTRTNIWEVSNLGGGSLRVRQVINGQTYDESYSSLDDGGGRFRLIGRNPDGSTSEMSGTYDQSQFRVSTSQGQNRITITGTRQ